MNEINFDLKLKYSGAITESEIAEVQKKVLEALAYYADTHFMSPDESDFDLVNVQVFEPLTQSMICKEF